MGGKRKQDALDKWKVLMTTTLIQSVIGGVVESYGAFFVPMMTNVFKNDPLRPTKAALIGSLASGFQLGFSPVSSTLTQTTGPLIVAVFGGIIVFLATFSASFAREFLTMALAYGVCLGIGCSLLFISNNIIISQHFGEDSTLAFGLLGFGNGVMNSVMPHIMAYAVDKITLFGAIRTISLILSPMMFLPFYWKEIPIEYDKERSGYRILSDRIESQSMLFEKVSEDTINVKLKIPSKQSHKNVNMSNKNYKRKQEYKFYSRQMWQREVTDFDMVVLKRIQNKNTSNTPQTVRASVSKVQSSIDFVDSTESSNLTQKPEKDVKEMFTMFRNKGFLNLCCAMVISSLGYQVANIHMVNFSNYLNLYGNPQILLTCLGGASAVGPLINPLFIDKFEEHISKFRIFQIFVLIYGVTVTLLPLVTDFSVLMVLCTIIGYADGSFSTLVVPLIIDLVGTENSGQCIGIYYGSISISVTIAAPLAGFIYSTNNSYTPAFYCAGLLFTAGGILLSLTHKGLKFVDPKLISSEMATIIHSKLSPTSEIITDYERKSKERDSKFRRSSLAMNKPEVKTPVRERSRSVITEDLIFGMETVNLQKLELNEQKIKLDLAEMRSQEETSVNLGRDKRKSLTMKPDNKDDDMDSTENYKQKTN